MEPINFDEDEDLERQDMADSENKPNELYGFKKWLWLHPFYLEKALQEYAHELYPSKEDTHTRWFLKRLIRKQIRGMKQS